jgi:hypothetical protein
MVPAVPGPVVRGDVEVWTAAYVASLVLADTDPRRALAAAAVILARRVDREDVAAAREWRLTLAALRPPALVRAGPAGDAPDPGDELLARRRSRRLAMRERYARGES